MPKPTADEIHLYMAKHKCGIYQAKAELMREYILDELQVIKRIARNDPGTAIIRLSDVLLEGLRIND